MRLKLTLRRAGGPVTDLVAAVDQGVTVAGLAGFLAKADPDAPQSTGPGTSLRILDGAGAMLAPTAAVESSGLRAGATVVLADDVGRYADPNRVTAVAAVLRVIAGPDAGKEFPLPVGTAYVGRDSSCDVRLGDPLVSRQHAKVHVTDVVEVVDLGSSNGVLAGGGRVPRVVLRPDETVQVGDDVLTVTLSGATGPGSEAAFIPFNRSPRLDPSYEGVTHEAPEVPQRPPSQRFPLIPLIAPLFVGAILFLVTRSATSLVFVALSPALMVGNAVESRVAGRRAFKEAVTQFRADLADVVTEAERELDTERQRRLEEHPATADCTAAAVHRAPLLWTRRPTDERFLQLRLGVGRQPSRSEVRLPTSRQGPRELWAELRQHVAPLAWVDGVPVVASLGAGEALGVAGPRALVADVARALVAQLITLHSPADLVVAACTSASSAAAWDWLKWLPHTTSVHSPIGTMHLGSTPHSCHTVVSALEELVEERSASEDPKRERPLPVVLLLVEDDAPLDRSRLVDLAEGGGRCGVIVVWVAPSTALLPAACRTFLEIGGGDPAGLAGFVRTGEAVHPVQVERLDEAGGSALGRALAPVLDAGARIDDESELPESVSFLALAGRELADVEQAVIERWVEGGSLTTGPYVPASLERRAGSLRAVIGQTGSEPFVVDLRAHGPHALVGGTTGSGKSELLQTWILAMAAAHSPQRVTFLLVDYKGGSAFSECTRLPHTVGLVTDLSPHLVRRALTSLNAELRFREQLLAAKGAKDLLDLERRADAEAPPSLVIVVDEFAALVQEVPEFVDGVVNVAQRGRSLGLHLVLATQRPAGVIKDNLRANTNLRLALRVADESDSVDVLGTAQAATFDPSLPGRAAAKTGPGRVNVFQAAYVGGWTTKEPPQPNIHVEELTFGSGRVWTAPHGAGSDAVGATGPTDIQRLVANITRAADVARVPAPRKPWLPELAHVYDLAMLPTRRRDDTLVFGVRDDPERQEQPTLSFRPDRDGNLAVFGTGGSGKSTLLRTMAIAASFTVRGGPCHVYGLDFGARGLHMLEALPHVGSIIGGDDYERVARLLGWLADLIAERAARYARLNAGTISDYRRLSGAEDEPRIFLLLDGIAAFRQAYEVGERAKLFEQFLGIASDGRPVGVHVVLSADRPGAMPSALASAVQRRLVLRLADASEYGILALPADVLGADSPPGRGMLDGAEVQVAVLGGSVDIVEQAAAITALASSMQRAEVLPASPIRRLTDRVDLSSLPVSVGDRPVLGLQSATLGPVGIDPQGGFLVTGPPASGRTTTLVTLVSALRRWTPDLACYFIGGPRSPLAGMEAWAGAATSPDAAAGLAQDLLAGLDQLSSLPHRIVLVVEGIADFLSGPADFPLQELVKVLLRSDGFVIAEGETSSLTGSFPLLMLLKGSRAGLALQPDQLDGTAVFRTNFPRLNRADFPPGRGLLVGRGSTTLVQVAMP